MRGEARAGKKSGVFGFNNNNTTEQSFGVSGTTNSANGFSFGVFGFVTHAGGVGGDSVSGKGVHGHSNENDGVRGESDKPGKSGVFGFNSTSTGDQTFGVGGSTSSVNLFSFGVFGFADAASGVGGNSKTGYGGLFSGGRAPLRLVPSNTQGHPTDPGHQAGELFVDSSGYNGVVWNQVVLA